MKRASIAIVGGFVAASGCKRCEADRAPIPSNVAEPAVAAPDDWIADGYLTAPNTTWSKLQRGVGGAAGILPASAGGILCAALGFDVGVGAEVDGGSPAYVVFAGDPADASFAVAMRLTDPRHARTTLLEGETARFSPREADGLTELVAKNAMTAPHAVAAMTRGGFLVFAKNQTDLARLGPYVSRTLPSRPLPTEGAIVVDVPHASIARITARLEKSWADGKAFLLSADDRARKAHRGRAPDFGDPKAIVSAVEASVLSSIAIVRDVETLRMTIDVSDSGIDAKVEPTALAAGGPASGWVDRMRVGDSAPLKAASLESAVAVLVRSDEAERVATEAVVEEGVVGAFGAKLDEDGKARVRTTLSRWAKVRGDHVVASLSWDDPRGLFLRFPVRDSRLAQTAATESSILVGTSPFREIVRTRDSKTVSEDLAEVGKVTTATFGPATPVGASWVGDGETFSIAIGADPKATLRAGARPSRTLGDDPAVTAALAALGSTATAILVAQPLRIDPKRANLPVAPVLVALGKTERRAYVRVHVSNGVLREAARGQFAGF